MEEDTSLVWRKSKISMQEGTSFVWRKAGKVGEGSNPDNSNEYRLLEFEKINLPFSVMLRLHQFASF